MNQNLRNKLQWNNKRNSYFLIHKNVFENVVWKIVAILTETLCKYCGIFGVKAWSMFYVFNTLRLGQDGRHFTDDIFKCIFLNENIWISLQISLEFVLKVRIDNIPALVQIMAWCWQGDKPLYGTMMISLSTHKCVTRPQWVNSLWLSNATRQYRFVSALFQVMVSCLTASSHYLNQCWPITDGVLHHSLNPLIQRSWKGGILVSRRPSVHPSVLPPVDRIVSALYHPQY